MSFFDSFRHNRSSRGLPHNAMFRVTQEGKEKATQCRGDARSQILVALETNGTSTAEEISQSIGLSRGQVERELRSMMPVYVQVAGGVAEEGE